MPVRSKIATWLGEQFAGVQVWDGRIGECRTMPTDDYYANRDAAEALYVALINNIDWPRILIESMSRHGALEDAGKHPDQRHGWMAENTCSECIREALLAGDRLISWIASGEVTPTPPAPEVPDGDFARVLGEALKYRRP